MEGYVKTNRNLHERLKSSAILYENLANHSTQITPPYTECGVLARYINTPGLGNWEYTWQVTLISRDNPSATPGSLSRTQISRHSFQTKTMRAAPYIILPNGDHPKKPSSQSNLFAENICRADVSINPSKPSDYLAYLLAESKHVHQRHPATTSHH